MAHIRKKLPAFPGDGELRYAPAGGHWLSEWDFDVETD